MTPSESNRPGPEPRRRKVQKPKWIELSAPEMKTVEEWLLRTFPIMPKCPVCGGGVLGCDPCLYALPAWSKRFDQGGRVVLCYECQHCAHLLIFSADRIGIVGT